MSTLAEEVVPGPRSLTQIRAIASQQGEGAAEEALLRMLKDEPNSPDVLMALARLLSRQKRYEDAAKAVEKAILLAPLDPRGPIGAGFIQIRLEQRKRAAEHFAEAIRLDPNSAPAHLGLAAVQMLDEDYETALRFCDRAIDLDPSLDRAYELVARINFRQGRKDLAIAELKAILDEDPTKQRVVKAYIRLLRSEGRSDEAIEFLEEAVARKPENRKAIDQLARVAIREGRPAVAVRHYRKLIEDGSERRTDRVRLIAALIENGDIAEANAEIEALGPQRWMQPIVHALRGNIARKNGAYEDAISNYRNACAEVGTADAAEEGGDNPEASPEERAEAWKKRAFAQIRSAVRERRNRRGPERGRQIRRSVGGKRS